MPPQALPIPSTHPPASAARIDSLSRKWAAWWMLLLAGLAMGGKGTAYIGLPPIFITEVILVIGCVLLLLQPGWRELLKSPTVVLILAFALWGFARTLPYLGTYKIDALRDGVLYGYAAFALIIAGMVVSQPQLLPWILRKYRKFACVFLMVMPFFWVAGQVLSGKVPLWPWAPDVPIIDLSPGDAPVHLGAIVAFAIVGLFRSELLGLPRRLLEAVMPLLALSLVAIAGAVSRGGLVSFGLAASAGFIMRPRSAWARNMAFVLMVALPAVVLVDPRLPVPGRDREFSARQLLLNVTSIVSENRVGDLDGTKQWRLRWWGKIVDYTFHGEYFWMGKGFGINLADSDGFQVEFDATPLRSPHNGHLSVLARMGVTGFVLWVLIQVSWLYAMLNAYIRARQRSHLTWMMLFVFLVAYWLAISFNAAFDVYLEGPMGGVWYWSVIGFGLASVWVYENRPETLAGPEFEVRA